MKKAAVVITLVIISIACKSARTQQVAAVATPTVYVTDEAGVFDEASRKQLESTLAALKQRKKIDFSVMTVNTIDDNPIYDYSLHLAQERKKDRDRVEQNVSLLLLFVAVDDRQWHVQITRNLEPHLTNQILTNMSTPMTDAFRKKQYGEGIRKYVNAIIEKLDQLDLH